MAWRDLILVTTYWTLQNVSTKRPLLYLQSIQITEKIYN
jgi:hypothetical protein